MRAIVALAIIVIAGGLTVQATAAGTTKAKARVENCANDDDVFERSKRTDRHGRTKRSKKPSVTYQSEPASPFPRFSGSNFPSYFFDE